MASRYSLPFRICRAFLLTAAILSVPVTCQLQRQPEVNARSRFFATRNQMKEWDKRLAELRGGADSFPAARPVDSAKMRDADGLAAMATYGTFPTDDPPADPFMKRARMPILYQTDGKRWAMLSAGPDRKYSIPAAILLAGGKAGPDLLSHCYDPTNGTFSPGDIFRTGPEAAP